MKKLVLGLVLASSTLLASCGEETDASKYAVSFYKDTETTCQYVIYTHAYGVAMVPRMDVDGSQMCDKK